MFHPITDGHGKLNIQHYDPAIIQTLYDIQIIKSVKPDNHGEVELLAIPGKDLEAAKKNCSDKLTIFSNHQTLYEAWEAVYCHEPVIWGFRNNHSHWDPIIHSIISTVKNTSMKFFKAIKECSLLEIIEAAKDNTSKKDPLHLAVKANKMLETFLDNNIDNADQFETLFNQLEKAVADNDHKQVKQLSQRFKI
jgi:hypothetical protein